MTRLFDTLLGIESGDSMRTFALAMAALLLASACTDDPQPIEPEPSPSSPAPSEPTIPASAKEDTPSGAANFVNYWVATFNYAAQTGDVEPMLQEADECEPCRGYAKRFTALDESSRANGQAWTISKVRVRPSRKPIEVLADVRVLEEGKTYPLTFVLNSEAPFELKDIYERESS